MQELHLVGFTTDHDALIFSARKGAKSGGFLVALDAKFYDTLDEAGRLRDDGGKKRGARRPSLPRPESALSPRDIQMRLRAGRSIANIASEAGVDEEWVARFAWPIQAEQAQVVARAQGLTFAKARLGASGRPLGEAVWWNIADKGVLMAQDQYDQCWTAHHLRDSSWIVRFDFVNRKKRQRAEWEVDIREATLTSRNRLASELGYIEPGRRGRPPAPLPPPAKPVVKKEAPAPVAARAVVAKRAPAKKKATTKKKTATKRAPAKKRATAKRAPAKKKATAKRATARKAPAKKRTAAKRTATRRPAVKKKAAARRAAPKRSSAKRPAPRKVAKAKRPAPKKTASRRPTPKKTPIKRAAAKRAAPRRPPAKKAARPRQPLRIEADSAASFDTPAFDTGEPTRPVTIRAPRASEPEPEPEPAPEPEAEPIAEVVEIDDFDNAPLPPPPVLTSTPRARTPRPATPAAEQRRFGRLRRRRPPGS